MCVILWILYRRSRELATVCTCFADVELRVESTTTTNTPPWRTDRQNNFSARRAEISEVKSRFCYLLVVLISLSRLHPILVLRGGLGWLSYLARRWRGNSDRRLLLRERNVADSSSVKMRWVLHRHHQHALSHCRASISVKLTDKPPVSTCTVQEMFLWKKITL